MSNKTNQYYISADEMLQDSYRLGMDVYQSGFLPTYVVGIWRGGTPVAIAVHELLEYLGVHARHQAIQTLSYTGVGTRSEVKAYGLEELASNLRRNDRLLLVDDVHDTGLSMEHVIAELRSLCAEECPDIRAATLWFKPGNNKTEHNVEPDYYLRCTEDWLVFPHELQGFSLDELRASKPALVDVMDELAQIKSSATQAVADNQG